MTKFRTSAVALGLAGLMVSSAALAAETGERQAVLAAVNTLLDSWREADNAKGERVLHPLQQHRRRGRPGNAEC